MLAVPLVALLAVAGSRLSGLGASEGPSAAAPLARLDGDGSGAGVVPALVAMDTVEVVVQVNGKLRDRLRVAAGTSEETLVELALASERVRAHLNDGTPRRTVVVPDRLVNLVA